MKQDVLNPKLKQRGRASVDFLSNLFHGSIDLRTQADAEARQIAAMAPESFMVVKVCKRHREAVFVIVGPALSKKQKRRNTSLSE